MDGSNIKIYSYHTFILPFTWEIPRVSIDNSYEKLKSIFENNNLWINTNLENDADILSKPDVADFNNVLEFYKEYQYFYPHVRKSIYGFDDNICANFLLKDSKNNGEYHIVKDKNHYILHIDSIRVRLVNTGVAIFIMQCENHGKDYYNNSQKDIEVIKDINDYGRRITLPFINEYVNINADRLEVRIPGIGNFVEDYKSFISDTCKGGFNKAVKISLNHICGFIKDLLSCGSGYNFISRPSENKDEIRIYPALDDRMYVAFAVEEKNITEKVSLTDTNRNYLFLSDDELNKSLYEIAFTDHSNSCTCPDKEMRTEQVKNSLYLRWLPSGTFYTVTSMGFGMISSAEIGGNDNYLYESFLTCYIQMIYTIVIQKASIVHFNKEAANIARHFANSNKAISKNDIISIMKLQERHTVFDNQLFFSEVSSELQAIEMYDMLKDTFRLEEENDKLDKNLTSLYEITDTNLNSIVNASVEFLTYISIILSGAALLYSILFASDIIIKPSTYKTKISDILSLSKSHYIFLVLIVLLSVFSFVMVRIRNKRR